MYVEQFFVEGLACASYLVGCEACGVAAVIDPDRDVRPYIRRAAGRGLTITHIIETHLHADHVSGGGELAQRTGARIYVHELSGATFDHEKLKDGDIISIGNVRLQVVHTPGHTPESVTLLVSDTTRGEEPWLALTGDTLFVGDTGRPDLVGKDSANALANQMYDSLFNRLLKLDDSLLIYPGHGAGSLCGKAIGSMRSTTLGYERRHNPALALHDQTAFVQFATDELPEQPANHTHIKALNRRGADPLGDVTPRPLTVRESIPHFQNGAAMLDTRSKEAFVKLHVPGAVHLPAGEQLPNSIGFILPPNVPIVLLLADVADYERVVYSLARVGYDRVAGYLAEDLSVWESMGLPVMSGDVMDVDAVELKALLGSANGQRPVLVDVREMWEYQQGHIPGARLIPLGELAARVNELDPAQPIAVMCKTGARSMSAAAILGRNGFEKIYNLRGGITAWADEHLPLE